MKTPKFFFATAMDYLGRNGDKGQVMQIGHEVPKSASGGSYDPPEPRLSSMLITVVCVA